MDMIINSHDTISDSLINLLDSFNKKIFDPEEQRKQFSIPSSNIRVTFYLLINGPSSISQVAKDLGISKPNMTPIIDNLIMENLVNRYDDPNDRRIKIIEATTKANELIEKRHELMKDKISEKVSSLSDEDLIELNDVVQRMLTIINKLE